MASKSITILCVDDEEIPRTLRKMVLEKKGYRVTMVASGAEALAVLRSGEIYLGGIDLVLSDQMMPGMTGTELTIAIKKEFPSLPVVLISGVNEIPIDATHADRFVSKVGGPELLFSTVAEVLMQYGHTL